MPLYEYRCSDCGAQFEELLSSAGAEDPACRECRSRRVTRLLSAFAVQVRGGQGPSPEAGPCGACDAPQRGMCARNMMP